MPWAKIDDDAPSHPKFVKAGSIAAFGFWTAGNCYCNKRLTDGFIAREALLLISPVVKPAEARRLAAALVEAGLWEVVDGGWRVHDFHHYNPTAADVKAERQASADRIKRWREKRRGNAPRNAVTSDPGNASSNAVTRSRSSRDRTASAEGMSGGSSVNEPSSRRRRTAPSLHSSTLADGVTPGVTPPPARAVFPARPIEPLTPLASPVTASSNIEPEGGYRVHDGMFNRCELGRQGLCVKTEYLDQVPFPRQCDEHRVQTSAREA